MGNAGRPRRKPLACYTRVKARFARGFLRDGGRPSLMVTFDEVGACPRSKHHRGTTMKHYAGNRRVSE